MIVSLTPRERVEKLLRSKLLKQYQRKVGPSQPVSTMRSRTQLGLPTSSSDKRELRRP